MPWFAFKSSLAFGAGTMATENVENIENPPSCCVFSVTPFMPPLCHTTSGEQHATIEAFLRSMRVCEVIEMYRQRPLLALPDSHLQSVESLDLVGAMSEKRRRKEAWAIPT